MDLHTSPVENEPVPGEKPGKKVSWMWLAVSLILVAGCLVVLWAVISFRRQSRVLQPPASSLVTVGMVSDFPL